jgi:undecaprenyl-phosphate 4-deoxy-4-formamido-L-arabinose transferase
MNRLRERITHIHMSDQGCMLRAYHRNLVRTINQCKEVNTFIPALAYSFSNRPTEIEVAHEERHAGTSKYSLYKLIRLNFDLITGFSVLPLQWFSLLGIVISLGSLLLFFSVLITRWMESGLLMGLRGLYDRDILQFFLIGLALFGIGLLGEYVGRIYEQVRARPRYVVQAVLEADSP